MDKQDLNVRLSQIDTLWTLIFEAHGGQSEAASAAQQQLLLRYRPAVYRYLLNILHDPDLADELAQEFAVRFLRGDFHRADPSRGRFRDFVKRAIINLYMDYYRRQQARPQSLSPKDLDVLANPSTAVELEEEFVKRWREELLNRVFKELARWREPTDQPYDAILRLRIDHPDWTSAQMAEHLSRQLGKPITAAGLRQTLHRARQAFADLLLEEVSQSLEHPSTAELNEELLELGLLEYCRPALKRHNQGKG